MIQKVFFSGRPEGSAVSGQQSNGHSGAGFGFWTWRLASNQVDFDDFCAEILGNRCDLPRRLPAKEWFANIHSEDVERVRRILSLSLSGDRLTFSYECRVKGSNGQWIRILDRGSCLGSDGAGQPLDFSALRIVLPAAASFPPEPSAGPRSSLLSCTAERLQWLAASVGHDLNNFLMVISVQTQLLRVRTTSASSLHGNLDAIEKAVQAAQHLASRLLEAARAEAGTPGNRQVELDLNEVAAEAFALCRPLIPEDIRLELLSKGVALPVLASEEDVHQIVCNLLVNARDAVAAMQETGGKRILMTLDAIQVNGAGCQEHPCVEPGEYATLTVHDTGPGVAAKDRDEIFAPFYTTKETGKGTGMGLAIVLDILKKNKGGIALKTEPGMGAVFTAYLPLRTKE